MGHDEHMAGEGRLQQRLGDADRIMNRLAAALAAASPAGCASGCSRAEKIAGPDKFDGAREKLKEFKDQLVLKTSGYAVRFPNTQHMLRYAYEILFDPFGDFLKALDRHFGDLNEKHTAALALDKLR